jgi:predicted ATPase
VVSIEFGKGLRDLGELDDAWRHIDEATTTMQTSNQRWCEAETNRIAGEISLLSPKRDAAKAEGYFERALSVARQQQAKSFELCAAMSLARLWRDQGKVQQPRELLARFTAGSRRGSTRVI